MCKHHYKATRNMKNQGDIIPLKQYNNFPIADPLKMEIYKLDVKEFILIILRKLSEL
jgi:hypothetical protein